MKYRLLPSAAVDEGYLIGGELCDIVVLRSRTIMASQFVDEDEHEQLLTWMGLEHPQDRQRRIVRLAPSGVVVHGVEDRPDEMFSILSP